MAEMDIETLLFGEDVDCQYGDFEIKFETEGSFDDIELLEAVELIESQEMPAEKPVVSVDETDAVRDHGTPARGLESADKSEGKERFAVVDDTEMNQILAGATSCQTNKMTRWGVQQFKQWLSARGYSIEFENFEYQELDSHLERFYAEVRNADGQHYSKSTFCGIRAAINRFLRAPPFSKDVCLMSNPEFHRSNMMFVAMLKKLKRAGLDRTKHYPPIAEADLAKLRESDAFVLDQPKTLQRKVWFDIALAFARRGRENLQSLKKDAFILKRDDTSNEYFEMSYNEATKNHPGVKSDSNHESKTRMYAVNGSASCPVSSLKLYLSKLHPESEFLFQQARNRIQTTDDVWYTSRPVGPRTLGDMMKVISKEANLSQVYTNHSVRATTVTLLSHAGVDTREIMKISQHKNEGSVKSYNRDSSDAQKRLYSAILQGNANEITEKSVEVKRRCPLAAVSMPNNANSPPSQSHFQLTQNVQNNVLQQGLQPPAPKYLFQNCTLNFQQGNNPFSD